jgi:hypothetical protein
VSVSTSVQLACLIIVEGFSDQVALETLARRRDYELDRNGVSIMPIGGAHAIKRVLNVYGPAGRNVPLAGLCDLREADKFRSALEQAGLGANLTRMQMERLGFFVCVADLEDELIRALGVLTVERIMNEQGDLRPFRSLQQQRAQQGRAVELQQRRFIGAHSGHKAKYARALVEALDLRQVPRPLEGVLEYAVRASGVE